MEETLDLPPFPPLKWDGYFWTGPVVLPAWAGFQSRQGPYTSLSSHAPSDGSASLDVRAPDNAGALPTPEQAAAYLNLVDGQEATRDAILQAVLEAYPETQALYGYEDEEAAELMPDIQAPEQLRVLIGLINVHLFAVARDGVAYVGYGFRCRWDDEHGLGAMTHAGRVVEVGGADTAILEWIATRDSEKAHGD